MTLRPAYDEIVLEHGSNAVFLRPSLRAASTLERLHDGFGNLFRHVAELHTGTIRQIILTAATDRKAAAAFLQEIEQAPLKTFEHVTQAQVSNLCLGFIPAPSPDYKPSPNAKPVPWAEAYRELFRMATGALHWTPDAAWNATPTEITEAFAGHVTMLKAIHGSTDEDANSPSHDHATLDRAGLDKLRGKGRLA